MCIAQWNEYCSVYQTAKSVSLSTQSVHSAMNSVASLTANVNFTTHMVLCDTSVVHYTMDNIQHNLWDK